MQVTDRQEATQANYVSRLFDPARLFDSSDSTKDQQLQRLGTSLASSRTGNRLPGIIVRRKSASTPIGGIKPEQKCPNTVDNDQCWSVIADRDLHEQLKIRVDAFLRSKSDALYKRKRYVLSTYFELYLVGSTLETAEPTMVISCISADDYERVKTLIKKHNEIPDYPTVQLAATLGSPRSSVPLMRLVEGREGEERNHHDLQSTANESLRPGTIVRSEDVFNGGISIPTSIYIGSGSTQRKAILGGLITAHDSGEKFGLTVAHSPTPHGQSVPANILGNQPTNGSDGHQSANRHSNNNQEPPALDEPRYRPLGDPYLHEIGRVAYASSATNGSDYDWALVRFKRGLKLSSYHSPLPVATKPPPHVPTQVNLLTPRGLKRGILSAAPTYIILESGVIETWSVVVEEVIVSGDCGIWVVDSHTQDFYGQIVYGHPGDKVAYIISASMILPEAAAAYGGDLRLSTMKWNKRPRKISTKPSISQRTTRSPSESTDDEAPVTVTKRRDTWRRSMALSRKEPEAKEWRKLISAAAGCSAAMVCLGFFLAAHLLVTAAMIASPTSEAAKVRCKTRDMVLAAAQMFQGALFHLESKEYLEVYTSKMIKKLELLDDGKVKQKRPETDIERHVPAVEIAKGQKAQRETGKMAKSRATANSQTAATKNEKPGSRIRGVFNRLKRKTRPSKDESGMQNLQNKPAGTDSQTGRTVVDATDAHHRQDQHEQRPDGDKGSDSPSPLPSHKGGRANRTSHNAALLEYSDASDDESDTSSIVSHDRPSNLASRVNAALDSFSSYGAERSKGRERRRASRDRGTKRAERERSRSRPGYLSPYDSPPRARMSNSNPFEYGTAEYGSNVAPGYYGEHSAQENFYSSNANNPIPGSYPPPPGLPPGSNAPSYGPPPQDYPQSPNLPPGSNAPGYGPTPQGYTHPSDVHLAGDYYTRERQYYSRDSNLYDGPVVESIHDSTEQLNQDPGQSSLKEGKNVRFDLPAVDGNVDEISLGRKGAGGGENPHMEGVMDEDDY